MQSAFRTVGAEEVERVVSAAVEIESTQRRARFGALARVLDSELVSGLRQAITRSAELCNQPGIIEAAIRTWALEGTDPGLSAVLSDAYLRVSDETQRTAFATTLAHAYNDFGWRTREREAIRLRNHGDVLYVGAQDFTAVHSLLTKIADERVASILLSPDGIQTNYVGLQKVVPNLRESSADAMRALLLYMFGEESRMLRPFFGGSPRPSLTKRLYDRLNELALLPRFELVAHAMIGDGGGKPTLRQWHFALECLGSQTHTSILPAIKTVERLCEACGFPANYPLLGQSIAQGFRKSHGRSSDPYLRHANATDLLNEYSRSSSRMKAIIAKAFHGLWIFDHPGISAWVLDLMLEELPRPAGLGADAGREWLAGMLVAAIGTDPITAVTRLQGDGFFGDSSRFWAFVDALRHVGEGGPRGAKEVAAVDAVIVENLPDAQSWSREQLVGLAHVATVFRLPQLSSRILAEAGQDRGWKVPARILEGLQTIVESAE
jgi:hypothetical protein